MAPIYIKQTENGEVILTFYDGATAKFQNLAEFRRFLHDGLAWYEKQLKDIPEAFLKGFDND